MTFFIAYAAIPGISGDYEAMMTVIIAAILTEYRIACTSWGQSQLRQYIR